MIKIKKPSLKKLRWGIAGCGRFTETSFIPALIMLRRSTLVSVQSHSSERAKNVAQKFGVPHYFSDYDEFLNSNINAVYIGSANVHHYEQVIKAAKAGKNILCEKPLALNSAQAGEMVNVCNENNVLLTVNYTNRFHPLVKKARELLNSHLLGKLVSINLSYNLDFPPNDNFRFKKELSGGGALRDVGTHMIDLLRYFGGEITSIQGVVDKLVYKSEVDDFAAALVRFQNNAYGYFNVSYNNKKSFNRIEILGHKGALSIENLIGVKGVSAKLTILLEGEAKKAFRKRGNKLLYALKSIQRSFINKETPAVTGTDGLINLKLMEELERQCS